MFTLMSPLKILLVLGSFISLIRDVIEGLRCGEADFAVPSTFFFVSVTAICYIFPSYVILILSILIGLLVRYLLTHSGQTKNN